MAYWEPLFPYTIDPPNCYRQHIGHPCHPHDVAIDVAVFHQHRFAFYYWVKWTNAEVHKTFTAGKHIPALISFDWHQDLAPAQSKEDLRNLNQKDLHEVALFSWRRLNPLNDGHLRSSLYLNVIGDLYLVTKYRQYDELTSYQDQFGNTHQIHIVEHMEELFSLLHVHDIESVYLDIDLDYFAKSDDEFGDDPTGVATEEEILSIFETSTEFMRWIFPRLAGITLAIEPKWCGGMTYANYIMSTINSGLFASTLLTKHCVWKM